MKHLKYEIFFLSIACLVVSASARIDLYKEIKITNEKSLRVKINGSFETIFLNKGPADKVCTISRKTDSHSSPGVYVDYSISNGVGYLEIDLDRDGDHSEKFNHATPIAKAGFSHEEEGDWYITFPEVLPIDFDLEFDVGKADLNLSGLQITRLNLATGASKVYLKSYSPNQQMAEKVSIEAGIGKFSGEQLGNLNFKELTFEGGIGSYKLDLSGALRSDAQVKTEVGMGSLTIILPKNTSAKLYCEDHWLNTCNFQHFFNRGDGIYETKNLESSAKHVTIRAECGVGSINVKWSE